ncbi:hypothetical protein EDD15DRAFT_2200061 [Pisolithus albus]|nr:hypothetical protein EDD15DRAFT_2200061 [Pisolithus albus]
MVLHVKNWYSVCAGVPSLNFSLLIISILGIRSFVTDYDTNVLSTVESTVMVGVYFAADGSVSMSTYAALQRNSWNLTIPVLAISRTCFRTGIGRSHTYRDGSWLEASNAPLPKKNEEEVAESVEVIPCLHTSTSLDTVKFVALLTQAPL